MAVITQYSRINRTFIIHYTDLIGNLLRSPYIDLIYRLEKEQYSGNLFLYQVRIGDNWFNAARKLLKNSKLWWIMADLSDVVDPFTEFIPGLNLYVPNMKSLMLDILNFEVDTQTLDADS